MKYRVSTALAAALASAVLAGCSAPKPAPPAAPVVKASDFNTRIPLNEVMAHAMSPAAFQFWGGWGSKSTPQGTVDLAPKNEAEWKRVEDGAITVLLLTNVLKLPGYAREPFAEWNSAADKVAAVAVRAQDAAERQDKEAIGVIGGELDVACEGCHQRFIATY